MRLLLLCLLVLCVVWNVQTIPTIKLDTSKLDIPEPEETPDEDKEETDFEGDMRLSKKQKEVVKEMIKQEEKIEKGGATVQKRKHYFLAQLWPHGIVPFEPLESGDFRSDQVTKDAINGAMRHIMTQTCIRFSRVTRGDRIRFVNGKGCNSPLGKRIDKSTGVHVINLGKGCGHMGIAAHEMLHALGFMHEQSRPDRDKYVSINLAAIPDNMEHNFKKYTSENTRFHNTPYDLGSIMHYGTMSFSIDGKQRTIIPRDPSKESLMGQRDGLSRYDAQIVRATYKCSGSGTGSTSGITTGTPCANQNIEPPCTELSGYCNQQNVQDYCPKMCKICTET